MKDADICIILGNLLDNAAEALENTSDKKISVKMLYEKNMLFIGVSNTYSGELRPNADGFDTTKKDGSVHGIGLANINDTVKKYGGSLSFDTQNGWFCVKTVLFENGE